MTDIMKALAAARELPRNPHNMNVQYQQAIAVIDNLLAAIDEQKPVLYVMPDCIADERMVGMTVVRSTHQDIRHFTTPLYAAPPDYQRGYKDGIEWAAAQVPVPGSWPTPASVPEGYALVPFVNHFDAQRVAAEYGLPYNAFCAAHRAMLAAQGVKS